MSIISYLQSKKILPSKEVIIKQQAKKLANQVCKPEYFMVKINNHDLSEFSNEFVSEMLNILTDRYLALEAERNKTEEAINNLKCNK